MPFPEISNYTGCLLGGAIGDALGAPIEFQSLNSILKKHGNQGVIDYVEFSDKIGRITDDTQMTLFTAEALVKARDKSKPHGISEDYLKLAHNSYKRWLQTQRTTFSKNTDADLPSESFLMSQPLLFKTRAPGNTCLSALQSGMCGTIEKPINNSKGCGGIMRVAPVGLIKCFDPEAAFKIGAESAAITHGHPSGTLSAGTFAAIIAFIRSGRTLEEATSESLIILRSWKNHEETRRAVELALELVHTTEPTFSNVEKLGGGWVGEEALAISIYCALQYQDDFQKGVVLAINHSGDTDSTGSITGNLLGFLLGEGAIPNHFIES